MACTVPAASPASVRARACWLSQADRASAVICSLGNACHSPEHGWARCSGQSASAASQRANASAQRSYSPPATLRNVQTVSKQPYDPNIMRKLRRATNWRELRTILSSANSLPDAVDLCTALHCAQNLLGTGVRSIPEDEAAQLRSFVKTTLMLMLERSSSQPLNKGSQTIANALTSLARLHIRPARGIMTALCARARRCCTAANPQALANTAMGLALLRVQPEEEAGLIDAVIRLSLEKLHLFKLEETCQLLWALASLNIHVDRSASLFSAALAYWPSQLQASLESVTAKRSSTDSSSQNYNNSSSNNNSSQPDAPRPASPSSRIPGNTAAASSAADSSNDRAGRRPAPRVRLKPKNVVQLAFAYAKVDEQYVPHPTKEGQADEDVAVAFKLVLPEVMALIPSFTPQGLSLVIWSYAKLRVAPRAYPRLVWAAYPAVCAKLGRFTPHGLVLLAYALALARFRHEPLLDVVTGQCTARMSTFSARDCAALAWSLGKLAYSDSDLMNSLCERYVAACTYGPPQPIGTISQMLKGATLQRCLTKQLLRLLQAQAAIALGSQERSTAVLQDVLDGYSPASNDSRSSSSHKALLFQHNSHIASLLLSTSTAPSSSPYITRQTNTPLPKGTPSATRIFPSEEEYQEDPTATPAASNNSSESMLPVAPARNSSIFVDTAAGITGSERLSGGDVSASPEGRGENAANEQQNDSGDRGSQPRIGVDQQQPQGQGQGRSQPPQRDSYVNSRQWGMQIVGSIKSYALSDEDDLLSSDGDGGGLDGGSRGASGRERGAPELELMPGPLATFKAQEQGSRREVPRERERRPQKIQEESSTEGSNREGSGREEEKKVLEGVRRPEANGSVSERDVHEQCMADMDAEEVYRAGGRKRQKALERSPFFREVCRVLRQMGETVQTGSVATGGILCDIVVSRIALESDPEDEESRVGSHPICLQLLEDEQLVAVVPRGQARCTPEATKSALVEASDSLKASDSSCHDEASSYGEEFIEWAMRARSSRLGMQEFLWEPDGNAQLYIELLSRSMHVTVVTGVDWLNWSGHARYSTASHELTARLKQARTVACSGRQLASLRPRMHSCALSAVSDTLWSSSRCSFSYC